VIHNRKIGYIKTPFLLEKSQVTVKGNIKDYNVFEKANDQIRNLKDKLFILIEKNEIMIAL
jgi:hypothetical protein